MRGVSGHLCYRSLHLNCILQDGAHSALVHQQVSFTPVFRLYQKPITALQVISGRTYTRGEGIQVAYKVLTPAVQSTYTRL